MSGHDNGVNGVNGQHRGRHDAAPRDARAWSRRAFVASGRGLRGRVGPPGRRAAEGHHHLLERPHRGRR